MGISVSKEQYMQACAADLYEFLVRNHASDVKVEYGSALLRVDKHVSVKRGFHGYRNFKTGETGNNIDYLMHYLGYKYQDAVLALLGETSLGQRRENTLDVNPVIPETREIVLPAPLKGQYRNLYAYMMSRKISADTIRLLVDRGILYQSAEGNNVVFVSPQGDYCEIRGTNSYADRRCKRRKECDRYCLGEHTWCALMDSCDRYKPDPYHGCKKTRPDRFWYLDPDPDQTTQIIYVCEAAMDAVSLYVIHQLKHKTEKAVYVSIGGAANQQTIDRLVRNSRHSVVVLAVDNDEAGQKCRDRNPNLDFVLPVNKDWNDDLKRGDY